ncbi:hypothetical protein FJQ98_16475 [Lysinibacillus agricola]|uniref:Uncharacterized protein n=1 Tax=Lysinibacillus agricola TaxID=2590012 RepID=A0ABX7AMW8_9BACI|nr:MULTISPECIES: hypothetical protein [Lysinibacillus]KOS61474.1 hypothetical protein AN161_17945 [Lysinibacillus sp. FJAT-14222]QQP10841.1 hypothetical protein FJQ98_16475 [Lysinibacillus agricola]
MRNMPYEIKQKLRQYNKANLKAKSLHDELVEIFEEYGVPYENLTANQEYGDYQEENSTEGLAFINNNEGDIEENIAEIEEVFLHFVNRNSRSV